MFRERSCKVKSGQFLLNKTAKETLKLEDRKGDIAQTSHNFRVKRKDLGRANKKPTV